MLKYVIYGSDLLNYGAFIFVFIFNVRYLNMSYECVWERYDRYDIYVHIKFKCVAHNFTGRVIQSTGNGMGTCSGKRSCSLLYRNDKTAKLQKTILLPW